MIRSRIVNEGNMLRLMHVKEAQFRAIFIVALTFMLTSSAWALVKPEAPQRSPSVPSFFPSDRPVIPLPAALDPQTDLEDRSDTTRDGLSRRAMLLSVADDFARSTYIPYVWGGNKIGAESECQACRTCLLKQRKRSVQKRHRGCSACQQCGLDCSHFVNRIYRDAGMAFPYASTAVLKRSSPETIRSKYGLVYVGKDLRAARPGDLILKDKHIVMLLQMRDGRRGDILHVSRSHSRRGVGGVELVTGVDVNTFSGRLVRIFRHEMVVEEELKNAPESPQPLAPTLAPAPPVELGGRSGLLAYLESPVTGVPWRPVL